MKPGVRALGIAESFRPGADRSTIAGVVARADSVIDGMSYRACTVGGTDATEGVIDIIDDCCRPDVQYVLLGAIAPAWYNILDLTRLHEAADRPVIAVTFEESDGLEAGIRDAFDGTERTVRLERYRGLSERHAVSVNEETVYLRQVGCDLEDARRTVRAFTPEDGRPEPIRVASVAARAGAEYAQLLASECDSEESAPTR